MQGLTLVGGNIRYPTLQTIADLFRSSINDTANNTGAGIGTGDDSGLIMPNSNPDLLTFMGSAIRETYSDLRNVGEPQLILDNYIVMGLPALARQNPAVQVGLGYAGYFDGEQWHGQWKLPFQTMRVMEVWERQTGGNNVFQKMRNAPAGIGGYNQGPYNGVWEMREGVLWMPGATLSVDLRIRATIGYPVALNPVTINFQTTYVPLLDCENAVVAKMLVLYCRRVNPGGYEMAMQEEKRLMGKLILENVRQQQQKENARMEYGADADSTPALAWGVY